MNIFMISLEENFLPKLESHLCNWERYIDICAYVLPEKRFNYTWIKVYTWINNFYIKFTYELELDNKLPFLDICVTRINKNETETSAYRKAAITNIYKTGTPMLHRTAKQRLTNLVKRAKLISSTKIFHRNEIDYEKTLQKTMMIHSK